jgi:alkanesulfonate monooxygenase SsuD/methylene tetrahydromethanopterin reductase-like flavin-dependent oxidoreductase (luciferase family)
MKFAAYAMPSYCDQLGLTEGELMRATVQHLASAERLGFDAVWVNEHHFHQYGGLMPSLPTMLAALAQATSTVRLGTSVVVLPLHHPLEVAEQLAMVDLISNGRVEFGVGRGFVAHDYEVMGVPYEDAQDRLIESLEVVVKAWSERPFSHDGRYYQFADLALWPQPQQRPHPPIWIACSSSPKSFTWTATHGYRLLTIGYTKPIAETAKLTRIYLETWASAGHPQPPTIATHYHVVVTEEGNEARRIAESGLAEHVRLNRASRALAHDAGPTPRPVPIAQLVDEGRLIAGNPDDCARMLRRAADEIGCTETHCLFQFGNISFAAAQRSMELFAAEVMPRLRASEPADSSHPVLSGQPG